MGEALPDAETVARALGANAEAIATGLPGGWASGPPEARAFVTGLRVPTMNGVCAFDETARPAVIERSLDEVRAAGVPFALLARPGTADPPPGGHRARRARHDRRAGVRRPRARVRHRQRGRAAGPRHRPAP